ncbi:MAG: hypothetical protein Q4G68_04000 [Planctomycetia bacterium]|nr:hypothetical protein [Planctomycetia bacterium]
MTSRLVALGLVTLGLVALTATPLFAQEPPPFFLRDSRSDDVLFVEGLLHYDLLDLAREEAEKVFASFDSNTRPDSVLVVASLLLEIYDRQWYQEPAEGQHAMVQQIEKIHPVATGVPRETSTLQALWSRYESAYAKLTATIQTAPTDYRIPEQAGRESLTAGQNTDAIALYDQAGRIALTQNDRENGFRLLGAAAALAEKSDASHESVTARIALANRFFELAETFPEQELAPALYMHGVSQINPLVAAGDYPADDLLDRVARFVALFPNAEQTTGKLYETAFVLLARGRLAEGHSLLTQLIKSTPPDRNVFLNSIDHFNQGLNHPNPELASVCLQMIQHYDFANDASLTAGQVQLIHRAWALALAASGERASALKLIQPLLEARPQDLALLTAAAGLLAESPNASDKQLALGYWNQAARLLEEGSQAWRDAKRNIIALLRETGRDQDADKLQKLLELVWTTDTPAEPDTPAGPNATQPDPED